MNQYPFMNVYMCNTLIQNVTNKESCEKEERGAQCIYSTCYKNNYLKMMSINFFKEGEKETEL